MINQFYVEHYNVGRYKSEISNYYFRKNSNRTNLGIKCLDGTKLYYENFDSTNLKFLKS